MRLQRLIKLIILILILMLLFLGFVDRKGNLCQDEITKFRERGVLIYTDEDTEYYKVLKKYDYEDATLIIDDLYQTNIGTTGDIYLRGSDPVGFFFTKTIFRKLESGHGAIVGDVSAHTIYEVLGNSNKDSNKVLLKDNKSIEANTEDDFVAIRVKGINNDIKEALLKSLDEKVGSKYNYLIPFHVKNRYYCTDLISKSYSDVGVDITNAPITYGSEIINSENTYIIYYRCKEKGVYKIYFLSGE